MIKFISPSLKYEINAFKSLVTSFIARLSFWRWKTSLFQLGKTEVISVKYIGREMNLPLLKALFGVSSENEAAKLMLHSTQQQVTVFEVPMPNTLCIPHCLLTLVTLDVSIDDILAGYARSLRRSILKSAPNFQYQAVTDEAKIEEIDANMLKPYAINRNGLTASQVPLTVVKDLALNDYGRLDLLYEGDTAVGCHLGNAYSRNGKRYWHVNRFGYTETVFSDYSRLQEVNSANLHLALLYAIENGYDFCDYGPSLAKPGSGLIEWKRRRKGFLAKAGHDCFYVNVPKQIAPQFFFDTPLFSLNGEKVNLHLGLPNNISEEELAAKYREMGYDGLSTVYLMCATKPSDALIKTIATLYADLRFQPEIIVSVTT